jgi:hypothetical protein
MTDSDGNVSQLEAYLLQLPENETPDLNPPDWYIPYSLHTRPILSPESCDSLANSTIVGRCLHI